MAYVDIFATEARGMYSPPNGNDPQMIPDYWRPAPGEEVRTDLPDLTDAELNALGWKGPIANVSFDFYTQDKVWNKETREYDILELDQNQKEKRVNYQKFWDLLLDTDAYTKIKSVSSQSLEANTLATEFIALMSDAKRVQANVEKIQQILTQIISGIPFTPEELGEIQEAFTESGMYAVYTLQ
jgi:hypothetical protein